ncbi:Short-chain dehydrogenase srdC [Paramyrothecium foliicola]|nr:Short-chain dehydrogenase srdC [Paramyrothecium foliicola]
MGTESDPNAGKAGVGYCRDTFPIPGLTAINRYITGHDDDGKSVFLSTDSGDHYRQMGDNRVMCNILYSTQETPVDLNGNADIRKAKESEPPLHYKNGTVVRLIDYAPNVEGEFHRAVSIDYGIVLDGVFKLTLDSGEERIMRPGDICVQRATCHKWHNITGNEDGTLPVPIRIQKVHPKLFAFFMSSQRQKFALISGCGQGGIGEALVHEYIKQGIHAIATILPAEDPSHFDGVASMTLFRLDVTIEDSIEQLLQDITELTQGYLDVLVNNAGICYTMTAIDTDVDEVKRMFDVNVFGPMRMVRSFHPLLIKAAGAIVNIGSVGGISPFVYGCYALIVGGGSGIGKACALAFAREGAAGIVVVDINHDAAEDTSQECRNVARNKKFISTSSQVDVSSLQGVEKAVHEASGFLGGRIDYCVNCAGIGAGHGQSIEQVDSDEFARFMQVNVTGTFNVTRAISALMRNQEPRRVSETTERGVTRGSIVLMGSAASYIATPGITCYTTSKHAVLGLCKTAGSLPSELPFSFLWAGFGLITRAAIDNVDYGIRVNCLCPTWVDTPMVRDAMAGMPELDAMIKAALPMKRLATVDEVADAALFMCSPRSSYITGSSLVIDGGATVSMRI